MHAGPLGGPLAILVRVLAVALLVGATYNPSGYSWWHWALDGWDRWVLKSFSLLLLIGGYLLCGNATIRSLGWLFGVPLAATIAAATWLAADRGWIDLSDATQRVLTLQAALIVFLGTGTSFSIVRYRLAGQMDSRTLA